MTKEILTGSEALAMGALRAGVKVATGYPGTPSTGALTRLLKMDLPGRHVEWSTNEKVAFEIAAGVAWAGHRALCTMKMSGLNVAYDSLISIAYSGVNGGLVVYVADDPGVSAGMCEQDSRGFALMSDLPMLEPATVAECYDLIQVAFELSEQVGTPVFVRLVTAVSNSHAAVQVEAPVPPVDREPILERDIGRYTKAGSLICMNQHRDLIARLEKARAVLDDLDVNRLNLSGQCGGLGIVAAGVVNAYLAEALETSTGYGLDPEEVSILEVRASHPFPAGQVRRLLDQCDIILVLEELEPYLERGILVEAQRTGFQGRIVGKLDGPLTRVGEYGLSQVLEGLAHALDLSLPPTLFRSTTEAESLAAARPITVCAGCPHRGTYLAIDRALRRLRLKRDQVMVTGDIGCTILGMNPPFDLVWNEVSMGASIGLAQGYVHAGLSTPVIATIGDSTFFHGGIPGLINAVQHQVPLTLIIMDNGWTAMTGMQVNPGTEAGYQPDGRQVDIAQIIPALGVEQFFEIDPFELDKAALTIQEALTLPGVKVVLARQECAIPAVRYGRAGGVVHVDIDKCNLCKLCIIQTGCPAIDLGEQAIVIDPSLCDGCGLCVEVCNLDALVKGLAP
ncbi:thiamine pyrophosphate-dependent enzyme [Chloroflexota bacterium]